MESHLRFDPFFHSPKSVTIAGFLQTADTMLSLTIVRRLRLQADVLVSSLFQSVSITTE
jgi:hypothetical protein